MKKIIVVGYPKSGNTWITRLVGELVSCPVKGFLYHDTYEIATEGLDKVSEFACFKSHHEFKDLKPEDKKFAKIIYVIRDPRDISLSGRPYFFEWQNVINYKINSLPIRIINKLYRMSFLGTARAKRLMNNAVLNGDERVHQWCKVSWKKHLNDYLEKESVLKIKYESMLNNPFDECIKIVDFIGIERSEEEINSAIDYQSFSKSKKRFEKDPLPKRLKHMRTGKKEQWRDGMTESEKKLYVSKLKNELEFLEYPIN